MNLKSTLLTAALGLTIMSAITAQALTAEQIEAQVVALQKLVTAQAAAITALQKETTANRNADTTSITTVQRQVTFIASNPALALGPFVTLDPNPENGVTGPNIVFTGANIHIVSGAGTTSENFSNFTGKGNLIVGYNESPANLQPGERGGSHNLIVGSQNTFSSIGGVVFGLENSSGGGYGSVLGGIQNEAGFLAVTVGGGGNGAIGQNAVVVGGGGNTAYAPASIVIGGTNNVADGGLSMVLSGSHNTAEIGVTILGGSNIPAFTVGSMQSGPITIVTPPPSTP